MEIATTYSPESPLLPHAAVIGPESWTLRSKVTELWQYRELFYFLVWRDVKVRYAQSILGIGFGAGVSAGTFTRYPSIEHITVCEIEPIIPPISTRFFAKQKKTVGQGPPYA